MVPIRKAAARVRAAVPAPPPLHNDWREIVRKAWSVRLMALAIVLSGFEAVLPIVSPSWTLPTWAIAFITFGIVGGAFWARISAQRNMGASE